MNLLKRLITTFDLSVPSKSMKQEANLKANILHHYNNYNNKDYQIMDTYINNKKYHINKPIDKRIYVNPEKVIDKRTKEFKRLIPKTFKTYQEKYLKHFPSEKDVRTILLTNPAYGSDSSYSAYINQNPNSEMFQHVTTSLPRKEVHNINDFNDKYFEDDNFTLKRII